MRVWFIGRGFTEYVEMFKLDIEKLKGKRILDCNAGASSFTAEMRKRGAEVKAADKLYNRKAEELERIAKEDLRELIKSHEKFVNRIQKGFFTDKREMIEERIRACKIFIEDYKRNSSSYVHGELPILPFKDDEFHLLLSANLLFLYEEAFTYNFHLQSVQEMVRVAREVRIYPVENIHKNRESIYLRRLINELDKNLKVSLEKVPYRLRGRSYKMLKIEKDTSA